MKDRGQLGKKVFQWKSHCLKIFQLSVLQEHNKFLTRRESLTQQRGAPNLPRNIFYWVRAFHYVAERRCRHILSVVDLSASRVLVAPRVFDPATLRHRGWRRDVPPGHHVTRSRAGSLESCLCPTLKEANRRALRRKPKPTSALLPVSSYFEAVAIK